MEYDFVLKFKLAEGSADVNDLVERLVKQVVMMPLWASVSLVESHWTSLVRLIPRNRQSSALLRM